MSGNREILWVDVQLSSIWINSLKLARPRKCEDSLSYNRIDIVQKQREIFRATTQLRFAIVNEFKSLYWLVLKCAVWWRNRQVIGFWFWRLSQ